MRCATEGFDDVGQSAADASVKRCRLRCSSRRPFFSNGNSLQEIAVALAGLLEAASCSCAASFRWYLVKDDLWGQVVRCPT